MVDLRELSIRVNHFDMCAYPKEQNNERSMIRWGNQNLVWLAPSIWVDIFWCEADLDKKGAFANEVHNLKAIVASLKRVCSVGKCICHIFSQYITQRVGRCEHSTQVLVDVCFFDCEHIQSSEMR